MTERIPEILKAVGSNGEVTYKICGGTTFDPIWYYKVTEKLELDLVWGMRPEEVEAENAIEIARRQRIDGLEALIHELMDRLEEWEKAEKEQLQAPKGEVGAS